MTPIAHYLAKQVSLPRRERTIVDPALLDLVEDIHCFEVTEIQELVMDLVEDAETTSRIDTKRLFLPAPRTWLEWEANLGVDSEYPELSNLKRMAVLLTEDGENIYCKSVFYRSPTQINYAEDPRMNFRKDEFVTADHISKALIYAELACINHPKIIGRRQHMPHRGLEKRLNQTFGVGKFPLHAWTEIKLEVTPTLDARRDLSIEAHYTGKRALHFCRAHLRLWNGKLIFVSAHWRGDGAVGIKRSRYKVVQGKGASLNNMVGV
jgi:hypothetical protein